MRLSGMGNETKSDAATLVRDTEFFDAAFRGACYALGIGLAGETSGFVVHTLAMCAAKLASMTPSESDDDRRDVILDELVGVMVDAKRGRDRLGAAIAYANKEIEDGRAARAATVKSWTVPS